MLVRSTCREMARSNSKWVSSTGWGGAREHVFPRLLESEVNAARPGLRERLRIKSRQLHIQNGAAGNNSGAATRT